MKSDTQYKIKPWISDLLSIISDGKLQVTRDNTLLLVVVSSIADLEQHWRVAIDAGSVVDSDGELEVTRDNTLLLVVMSSVVNSDGWEVASDEGQYAASCCRGQHRELQDNSDGELQATRGNTLGINR